MRVTYRHAMKSASFNVGAHGVAWQLSRGWDPLQDTVGAYAGPVDAVIAGGNVEAVGIAGIDWNVEVDAFRYLAEDVPVPGGWSRPSARMSHRFRREGDPMWPTARSWPGRTRTGFTRG